MKTLLLLLCLITHHSYAQWTQLGGIISGTSNGEFFGTSMDINAAGNRFIAGSPQFSNSSGRARVFSYNSATNTWVQIGSDLVGLASDRIGESVSINAAGDIVAIGGTGRNFGSSSVDVGVVKVYMYNGTSWVQMGSDITGFQTAEQLGASVSLSADGLTLATGSPTYDNGTSTSSGRIRVYKFTNGSWSTDGYLESTDARYELGTAVDISADGNTVVAGGPGSSNPTVNSSRGKMAIFNRTANGWVESYSQLGLSLGFRLGRDVSINAAGNIVSIMAPGDTRTQANTGETRIFQQSGNTWSQVSAIYAVPGVSTSLDSTGQTVAIGYLSGSTPRMSVYTNTGTSWVLRGSFINGVGAAGNQLSYDGYVIAGANPSVSLNRGSCVIFEFPRPCTNSSATINITNCTNYTSPSGNYTYTASGMYLDTIPNSCGLDSILTINLTINQPTNGVDVQTACSSYTWLDGNAYTSSNNTATFTLVGGASNGCDSVVTLNLTINQPTNGVDVQTACGSYTWLDGNTYTSSNNTATFTLVGGASNGCDSIVTLNLTITTINTSVTLANDTLMATTTGANYQWIDCANNTAILGATNQQFIPTTNGDYAVIISQNACVDTSNCITVVVVGLEGMPQSSTLIYPNPFKDVLQVKLGTNTEAKLRIINVNGQLVRAVQNLTATNTSIDLGDLSAGIYWLTIQSTKRLETYKIIKQ